MRPTLIAALAASLIAQAAAAQEAGSAATRDYIEAAAGADTFEMMEAYSALAYSHDARVLSFARQMIVDHGRTSQALAKAAQQAGLKPPAMQVGAAESPLLAALQSAQGPEFDRVFWKQQALAHRSALVTAQRYAASGDTPAIRQAAAAAVPVIQAHLTMADSMVAGG